MDTKIKPMQWNKATESLEDFKAKLEIREIIDAYDALLDELFQGIRKIVRNLRRNI